MLIAGKHGSLVDSMMLAHIDPAKQTITLLSVPRDLYINGRKINAVWQAFGMGELERQLTRITGYEISRYVLIDMYAFIEVIDLLGGVDVTLKERLIDPSYRTFDDGVWSTLHYEPGTHHLSGKQALRLARSRHYSTDFARSERQQLIINALKDKATSLQAGDADTLIGMIRVGIDNTLTDYTPQDVLTSLLRYKNYRVRTGAVLSNTNVLVSKRTNDEAFETTAAACAAEPDDAKRTVCASELSGFDRGAYILLPQGGNWELLKWYAWKTFEE